MEDELKIKHTKGKKRQMGLLFGDMFCTQTCPTLDLKQRNKSGLELLLLLLQLETET